MKRSGSTTPKRNSIGEDAGGGSRKHSMLSVDFGAKSIFTPQVIKEKLAANGGQDSQEQKSKDEL